MMVEKGLTIKGLVWASEDFHKQLFVLQPPHAYSINQDGWRVLPSAAKNMQECFDLYPFSIGSSNFEIRPHTSLRNMHFY